jgi:alpha-amylase
MKRIYSLILVLSILSMNVAIARKVKFAVDMSDETISSSGVFISGDFQKAAGLGEDFAAFTPLTREGTTNIYSIVVDVPAPAKYEYTFLNGSQWYFVEAIPSESGVSYDFDNYRWMYVDSAGSDTLSLGAVKFSGNAPANKYLVRVLVDMQNQTVSANGVHVAGSFNNWNTTDIRLYNFVDKIYEGIAYMPAGENQFKFYNGNALLSTETVPVACASNSSRTITVSADVVKDVVCYAACSKCGSSAVPTVRSTTSVRLYPSMATTYAVLKMSQSLINYTVSVSDFSGRQISTYTGINGDTFTIPRENLPSGVYFVRTATSDNSLVSVNKLIFK